MIDAQLLQFLACPWCVTRPQGNQLAKGELELQGPVDQPSGLKCKDCGRLYEIRNGIPNLIVEEAKQTRTS